MQSNPHKSLGILLIVLGVALASFIIVRSTLYAPDTELEPPINEPVASVVMATSSVIASVATGTPKTTPAVTAVPSHYPVRLSVPSANVNAGVQYVGIKADGSMANPSNFTDVAWYKRGTTPGEPGSAVIAGHVDNALALSGVFKHLADTKVGDDVYITRKDGVKLHFRVTKVAYYPYKEAPNREIFLSSDGKAHLNLVTCAGTWISSAHSYDKRLVVYTTLVE
ncbi:class F sortase [Candidatus Parcubacteria bacterium]|nr:class F sortase [Candidatus Parcubacteria bacterium]